jgi:hypothetical protein
MWKPTNMIWSYTSMLWDCFGCKVFSWKTMKHAIGKQMPCVLEDWFCSTKHIITITNMEAAFRTFVAYKSEQRFDGKTSESLCN